MSSHLFQCCFIICLSYVVCLPAECFNYYSEFSLSSEYNPNISPNFTTSVKETTILYKVAEVSYSIKYGKIKKNQDI